MRIERMLLQILVMASVTYLIRMLPLTLIRGKIANRFVRSLMYYMPFAVLAAMTIPDILFSTDSVISAAVGLAVACILALFNTGLLGVAALSCLSVLVTELLLKYL